MKCFFQCENKLHYCLYVLLLYCIILLIYDIYVCEAAVVLYLFFVFLYWYIMYLCKCCSCQLVYVTSCVLQFALLFHFNLHYSTMKYLNWRLHVFMVYRKCLKKCCKTCYLQHPYQIISGISRITIRIVLLSFIFLWHALNHTQLTYTMLSIFEKSFMNFLPFRDLTLKVKEWWITCMILCKP